MPNNGIKSLKQDVRVDLKLKNNNKMLIEEEDNNQENYSNIDYVNQYIQAEGPKDLKKFTVVELIGKGGESSVYKIKYIETNKFFCLKIMKKKKKERINYPEFYISKKIKHKNLINLLSYHADPNKEYDYMITELGKSNISHFMKKILKKSILSETFLCFIAYQTLQGLNYLHMYKIAHLDIKPQNLVITETLEIKIIDFSVSIDYSKINGEEVKIGYIGTNYFMSPEILQRKKVKKKDLNKIDMFSLGVTLYVLGFGRFPFDINPGDNDELMIEKINSGWRVENIKNYFSKHFIDLLNGLLEVDINKRMNIEQALNSYFIQGAPLLLNEKENTYNAFSFLSYLITDHIRSFQEYMSKQ